MEKPVVFYRGKALSFMGCVVLFPLNHPNHLEGHKVSNTREVHISSVISWDEETGTIETQNTIYKPEIV
jgi:hypothetical protein